MLAQDPCRFDSVSLYGWWRETHKRRAVAYSEPACGHGTRVRARVKPHVTETEVGPVEEADLFSTTGPQPGEYPSRGSRLWNNCGPGRVGVPLSYVSLGRGQRQRPRRAPVPAKSSALAGFPCTASFFAIRLEGPFEKQQWIMKIMARMRGLLCSFNGA